MSKKKQLTISEFARLTGIKRDNLRFYDRIGLLSPEHRGENNYRYYSRHQLSTAYLISGLRGIGVCIEDIKQYESLRSPKESLVLLAQQEQSIQKEIQRLKEIQNIMKLHSEMIEEAQLHEVNTIFLQEKEQEAFFICPPIPSCMDEDEASIFSYDYAEAHGIDLGYPVGNIIEEQNIDDYIQRGIGRYYFKTKNKSNAHKAAGLYAVAYGYEGESRLRELYTQLRTFIIEKNMRMCSDFYEEYPLNDISVHAKEHYGIRLEVQVEKSIK